MDTSSSHYSRRQAEQRRRDDYREVARQVGSAFNTLRVSSEAHVTETADQDGAFVECVVWVPAWALRYSVGSDWSCYYPVRGVARLTPLWFETEHLAEEWLDQNVPDWRTRDAG